mgnify:CR=1 FL=1|tara:strand:- start:1229 stop:1450 length:222 start_codon:yes stop_codon:yes gene_type:complete
MSSINENCFKIWVQNIDIYIYSLIDIHLDDLPDNTFRLDFNAGTSVVEMAEKVLKDTEWEDYYYAMKNKDIFS